MSFAFDTAATEDAEIRQLQQLPISLLDEDLSGVSFGNWLSDITGARPDVRWERNDCGEQTGNPEIDNARDLPQCIEATVLLRDGTVVSILVLVGTFKKGLHEKPSVYGIYVTHGGRLFSVRRLSELAEVLAKIEEK